MAKVQRRGPSASDSGQQLPTEFVLINQKSGDVIVMTEFLKQFAVLCRIRATNRDYVTVALKDGVNSTKEFDSHLRPYLEYMNANYKTYTDCSMHYIKAYPELQEAGSTIYAKLAKNEMDVYTVTFTTCGVCDQHDSSGCDFGIRLNNEIALIFNAFGIPHVYNFSTNERENILEHSWLFRNNIRELLGKLATTKCELQFTVSKHYHVQVELDKTVIASVGFDLRRVQGVPDQYKRLTDPPKPFIHFHGLGVCEVKISANFDTSIDFPFSNAGDLIHVSGGPTDYKIENEQRELCIANREVKALCMIYEETRRPPASSFDPLASLKMQFSQVFQTLVSPPYKIPANQACRYTLRDDNRMRYTLVITENVFPAKRIDIDEDGMMVMTGTHQALVAFVNQTALLASVCIKLNLVHGDLYLRNLLWNTDTLRMTVIDFERAEFFCESPAYRWLADLSALYLEYFFRAFANQRKNEVIFKSIQNLAKKINGILAPFFDAQWLFQMNQTNFLFNEKVFEVWDPYNTKNTKIAQIIARAGGAQKYFKSKYGANHIVRSQFFDCIRCDHTIQPIKELLKLSVNDINIQIF